MTDTLKQMADALASKAALEDERDQIQAALDCTSSEVHRLGREADQYKARIEAALAGLKARHTRVQQVCRCGSRWPCSEAAKIVKALRGEP